MDIDSTDVSKIDFDFSMIDLFGEPKGNNHNIVENLTFFSSQCGSFPDLEKVGVSS